MKRINIQKDVESRSKIASTLPQKPIVKPIKTEDAKSQEVQRAEDNPPSPEQQPPSPKRGRATKGNE